jgi:hypothetical protein
MTGKAGSGSRRVGRQGPDLEGLGGKVQIKSKG